MSKSVATLLLRRLVSGGNQSRYMLALTVPVDGAVRQFDDPLVRRQCFSMFSSLGLRTMSTSVNQPRSVEQVAKEKKVVEEDHSKQELEKSNEVERSSYWGISGRKIIKEDGSEWPWNCFMVYMLLIK